MFRSLESQADRNAQPLRPGARLRLDGRMGALSTGYRPEDVHGPAGPDVELPRDGLLVFALDAPVDMMVTGTLHLDPNPNLQPGLRALIACDTTLIGAPMVSAPPWQCVEHPLIGPAPVLAGTPPPARIDLTRWRLRQGRHHICVSAPHFRGGGTFRHLELCAEAAPAQNALLQFAVIGDTHAGPDRRIWMNTKLCDLAADELSRCLRELRSEGLDCALLAGDLSDRGLEDQFAAIGRACREGGLPVYGCIGNHDVWHEPSKAHALARCADLFPGGRTDYAVRLGPLRLVVLDGAAWGTDGRPAVGIRPDQLQWLHDTLAAEPATPTLFMCHFPLASRGGLTSCGYQLPRYSMGEALTRVLDAAPQVIATFAGHAHWNEVNAGPLRTEFITPAFCEWPNAYRVFRVYDQHIEWELRQIANRGVERESFVAHKAVSWMISTGPGDLGGRIELGAVKNCMVVGL